MKIIEEMLISIMLILVFVFFICFGINEYVNDRCREHGYNYGVFHITTGKRLCEGNDKYIPFKDAVK
jgi:hypothetical protein